MTILTLRLLRRIHSVQMMFALFFVSVGGWRRSLRGSNMPGVSAPLQCLEGTLPFALA